MFKIGDKVRVKQTGFKGIIKDIIIGYDKQYIKVIKGNVIKVKYPEHLELIEDKKMNKQDDKPKSTFEKNLEKLKLLEQGVSLKFKDIIIKKNTNNFDGFFEACKEDKIHYLYFLYDLFFEELEIYTEPKKPVRYDLKEAEGIHGYYCSLFVFKNEKDYEAEDVNLSEIKKDDKGLYIERKE